MKLPLSWLKEFVPFSQSPEELSHILTMAGLEEEGIEETDGEVVFDIGLTPNLGHCMSILGIARELSALIEVPVQVGEIDFEESETPVASKVGIRIEAKEECHRYGCRIVEGVKVGPSPEWLKKRLELSGIRSVNNVVDVGNYVMLEMGQPLHMFDFDKVAASEIEVRLSSGSEGAMKTLDDEVRKIPDGVLLVCDGQKPVAFAGVIGDAETAVTEGTTTVLIEAAFFTPQSVRKTSKALNLRSESSSRFERGVDPLGIERALDRAAGLLGKPMKGLHLSVAKEVKPHLVTFSPKRTNQLLGTNLSVREMVNLLERLELSLISESEDEVRMAIPTYRSDLKTEIDLIEEVGRLYGFNNLPRGIPRHASSSLSHSPLFLLKEEVRDQLVSLGLQECLTCDLISPREAGLTVESSLGEDAQVHVLHPASIDQSVLRPSLLPGLLNVVKFNQDRKHGALALFEVGHVHFWNEKKVAGDPAAAIVLSGAHLPMHFEAKGREADFFDLKGHVENFCASMGVEGAKFAPSHLHNFHPKRQASVKVSEKIVGVIGEVHPTLLKEMGVGGRVQFAELHLLALDSCRKKNDLVEPPPAYPGSERDWTVTLKIDTPVGIVFDAIEAEESPLLEKSALLALYKSEKIGKDRKNVSFRFWYRSPEKTVLQEEVEAAHTKIIETLAEKLQDHIP